MFILKEISLVHLQAFGSIIPNWSFPTFLLSWICKKLSSIDQPYCQTFASIRRSNSIWKSSYQLIVSHCNSSEHFRDKICWKLCCLFTLVSVFRLQNSFLQFAPPVLWLTGSWGESLFAWGPTTLAAISAGWLVVVADQVVLLTRRCAQHENQRRVSFFCVVPAASFRVPVVSARL